MRHWRLGLALAFALATALLVVETVEIPKAWSSCEGDHGMYTSDTMTVTSQFQTVVPEDWPLWLSVTWGDGSSYYLEKSQWGTVNFAVQHTYSPGTYSMSWSTGDPNGSCDGGSSVVQVP